MAPLSPTRSTSILNAIAGLCLFAAILLGLYRAWPDHFVTGMRWWFALSIPAWIFFLLICAGGSKR